MPSPVSYVQVEAGVSLPSAEENRMPVRVAVAVLAALVFWRGASETSRVPSTIRTRVVEAYSFDHRVLPVAPSSTVTKEP